MTSRHRVVLRAAAIVALLAISPAASVAESYNYWFHPTATVCPKYRYVPMVEGSARWARNACEHENGVVCEISSAADSAILACLAEGFVPKLK